jgi:hypothetical protein
MSTEPTSVVSPRIYALILTSPRLQQQLLPQGLITSPYVILNYEATLTLHDGEGSVATVERTQQVRFQQTGVAAILDHLWGDGVGLSEYLNSAGMLRESFKDEGRRHLVIGLRRPMAKGERLEFTVQRTARAAFHHDEEWLETTIDHPIARLGQTIIFPRERPCQRAELIYCGEGFPLHVQVAPDGSTQLRVRIPQPKPDVPYLIRWRW